MSIPPAPQDRHFPPEKQQGWKTSVTRISPGCVEIAGQPLSSLIGARTLPEVAHLLLTRRFPDHREHRELVAMVREGAAPALPFPERADGQDVCRSAARVLLGDEHLCRGAASGEQAELRKTFLCLGRMLRVLAHLLGTEEACAHADPDAPFSSLLYRVLTGNRDIHDQSARMLEALTVACADHGVTPPSTQATILASSVRAPYPAALAAGFCAITDVHGGAGERAAEFLLDCAATAQATGRSLSASLRQRLTAAVQLGKRIPGLGHRFHDQDPRCPPLLALARQTRTAGDCVRCLQEAPAIYRELRGVDLPLNVDGVIGAVVADLRLPPPVAKMVFLLGRVAGLSAHHFEELTRHRPMRWINFDQAVFE